MKTQLPQKKHWGWRMESNAAVFSFGESPSRQNLEDIPEQLHILLIGQRNSVGNPKISAKVSRNAPEDVNFHEHIVYGSLEFNFHVYFSGIILSETELDYVMKKLTEAIKARRAK
jgi:hypothetical protein